MERGAEHPEMTRHLLPDSIGPRQPQAGPQKLHTASPLPWCPHPGWTPPLPLPLGLLSCALSPSRDLVMGKSESPVRMVEIAGRWGQMHRSFLEGGLLLLLLLVTGALVALGLLYANSRGE